jgi:predicted PurR-regulated permease PerM
MARDPFQSISLERLLPTLARVFVWLCIFAILYILRSFFLLIFLTFVAAYIQASGVEKLKPWIRNRTARVIIVAGVLLGTLIGVGVYIVPRVAEQAKLFVDKYPVYMNSLDAELNNWIARYPILAEGLPKQQEPVPVEAGTSEPVREAHQGAKGSMSVILLQQLLGVGEEGSGQATLLHALDAVRNIGTKLLAIGSAFLLSLLFSFLIVLDLPNLAVKARRLAHTRVGFIYDEVAPTIVSFCRVLGKAFEAQLFIAILNAILTAAGMWLLGITEKVAFITVIVFICSFVPVAGVFISSIPICLVALQLGGFHLMIMAIIMITLVHMVETYILNPKIYGHHLRINPVIVLIILTVGGKLFHIWGLVLGVPVMTYIFGTAIRLPPKSEKEPLPVEA